jgi:RHS repeat-associated protein
VRQLTDAQDQITLAKAYNPYGEVTQSAGAGQSSYGYTSEYQDGYNQLVYLRARPYAPSMGRFLSRDIWKGDIYL